MFLGALFFWTAGKIFGGGSEEHAPVSEGFPEPSLAKRVFVQTREPICAGLIAGAALVGIGDILVGAFLL